MPKSKKRNGRGGQHGAVQPFSDEDASIETLSHCSSFSDSTSVAEEGGEAEDTAQEDFQYKLKVYIDCTVDKSAKTRQGALDGLKTAMATKILYEFLLERRMTVTDSIERCLKKGKGEEQRAAASLACLLCIQLGSGIESEEVFKTLKPIFKTILNDGAANIQARQACATSLGLCTLVAEDDILDVYTTMECFESLFTRSYVREDGSRPSLSPTTTQLHTNALLSWALLLTICSASHITTIIHKHLAKLPRLLESEDVNMRIAAGETIALLFELARDVNPDFDCEDWEPLCSKLNALATDCNKHRAKTDKRKQRSVFRDVLKAVEEGDFQTETIRFGTERMVIDSWVRKRTYDAFREFVGSGMNYHLQANEFIRDVFGLGPPVLIDSAALKAMKSSRLERHLYNAAAFKARTKARNKFRDKRVDVGWYLRERMQEISLDLDFLDQERKMCAADSLNNLCNMKVRNNLKDLLTGPPVSPQATTIQSTEGKMSIKQETTNMESLSATQLADASSAEDHEDRHSDISHTKAHSILIIIFILSLALILLASLALSAYALYLIAQSNEKIGEFSRSQQLHRKYLEEIREWKTIIQQVLHHSTALQAK